MGVAAERYARMLIVSPIVVQSYRHARFDCLIQFLTASRLAALLAGRGTTEANGDVSMEGDSHDKGALRACPELHVSTASRHGHVAARTERTHFGSCVVRQSVQDPRMRRTSAPIARELVQAKR